jgi:hypothetical protein
MKKTSRRRADACASYDARTGHVVVQLTNDASFRVPVSVFPDVAESSDAVRRTVRLSDDGRGLCWDALDSEYRWPYLMAVLLGPVAWRQASASAFAGIKSPAKARAARANGAKGGRPRKHATP